MKNMKKQLTFASLVTLLPMAPGLFLWDRLPEMMVSRWGFDGSVPVLAVLFLQPLLLLGLLWLCVYITAKDPGNRDRNRKVSSVIFWTIPVISNLIAAMMFAISLGSAETTLRFFPIFFGLLFAIIGNFMPKTRRNSTIGIKVSWALASDENWDATHRFAGRLWFLCGILIMLTPCLPGKAGISFFIALTLLMPLLPMVYSYAFYKKQQKAGTAPDVKNGLNSRIGRWSLAFAAVLLIFIGVMMFTGNIDYAYEQDRLSIRADYYSDMTIRYDDIDAVEFRETEERGSRTFGWGSGRLLMGAFENQEFGLYTRYSYLSCDSCVVVRSGAKVLVLSGRTDAETRDIYQALLERTAR